MVLAKPRVDALWEVEMNRYGFLSLGLLVLLSAFGFTADPAKEEKTGLKVGTKAPAFKLKDQNGKERTLNEFVKEGQKVALVFFRSADW